MKVFDTTLTVGSLVVLGCICSPAWAQRSGQSVSIQHGVVTQAKSVDLAAASGQGAMIGGLAGYVSGSGRSSSRRVRDAIIGSAVGAAATTAAQGNRTGMQYTVDTGRGEIVVVSDQREISIGDCVSVENAGAGAANIRRASSALCESTDPLGATVEAELQDEAADCLAAKEAMVAAETDEDIARAVRSARIVCDS